MSFERRSSRRTLIAQSAGQFVMQQAGATSASAMLVTRSAPPLLVERDRCYRRGVSDGNAHRAVLAQ